MYIYQIATKSSLDEIISLKNDVKKKVIEEQLPIWQNGYPEDELIIEDIEKGYGRVLIVDNQIVSYASYYPALYDYDPGTFPRDDIMSFGRVMTKVTETNKGYANSLIDEMIKETKQNNIPALGLLVDSFNKRALNIYLKKGFKYIRTDTFPWAVLDIYYLELSNE